MIKVLLFVLISILSFSCTKSVTQREAEYVPILFEVSETDTVGDGDNSFATEMDLGLIRIEGEQNAVADVPEHMVPMVMEWIHRCPILNNL